MWPFSRIDPPARGSLANVPGPSPWFFRRPGLSLPSSRGPLTWRGAGDDGAPSPITLLATPAGEPLLALGFHCYVEPLTPPRFLVWHPEGKVGDDEHSASAAVRFRVLDADTLTPIPDLAAALAAIDGEEANVVLAGPEVASVAVPTLLPDGRSQFDFPAALHEIDELLVLADSTANLAARDYWMQMHLAIWIIRPRDGTIDVVPQDWFNQGNYDFAYQGVRRVARDPNSGRLVGEGVRLDAFVLDESNRRVAKWLRNNPFSVESA